MPEKPPFQPPMPPRLSNGVPPPPKPDNGREADGRWKPGYVTNSPRTGRPPLPAGAPSLGEFRKLMRDRVPKLLERIDAMLEDPNASHATILGTGTLITDRAYGKAVQPVEVAGPGVFEQMSDDELKAFVMIEARDLLGLSNDVG